MSDRRGKKRPKSYYRKSAHAKRQKTNSLTVGMRGFLVTCNNNERQAVRESYNILNEYADELYGSEQKDTAIDKSCSESEEEEDMEKAMAKEVKALKQMATGRRFQNTETGAKNCIFIRTSLENPSELHHKIFFDLFEKKKNKARFAMRMLPVEGSCKAVLDEIKKLAETILPKHFSSKMGEDKTYSVVFKSRNNSGVSRDSVQAILGDVVKGLNPLNSVHCDNPDITIIAEVVCSICCLGVATDFVKLRKFNFHEVVKDSEPADSGSQLKEVIDSEVKPEGGETETTTSNGKGDAKDSVDSKDPEPQPEKCDDVGRDCSEQNPKVEKDHSIQTSVCNLAADSDEK